MIAIVLLFFFRFFENWEWKLRLLPKKKWKKNPKNYSSSCKDKTLGLIFEKQSLRTRLSFNVGMQKLGGSVLELQSKDIGFDNKREKAEDVLNVLSQYIDCLMIRNDNHKQIVNLSKENILPIINGLTCLLYTSPSPRD